jgi:hypothetical protein
VRHTHDWMKTTTLALLLCLLLCAGAVKAAEWELQKQADGIDVYTRPVADSDIMEFKGEGIVEVEVDRIVALMRDASRFKDWFPNTSESKLISREGAVTHQYSVMMTPWPVADRDNVFRSEMSRDESTGRVEFALEAAPEAYPIQRGRHRVTRARGKWQFTPTGSGGTRVIFTMHLEPGGGVPDWMVNARIVSTPFEALANMREILGASGTN